MAVSRPIFESQAAQRFRQIIRPSLIGNIGRVEPLMAVRMADEFYDWLNEVIRRAIASTELQDEKQFIRSQLYRGVRVTGRSSLRTLRGRITVQPWIFPHEYGATIRPQNGARALTIPIYHALRPDGSPKFRSANSWRRFGSFIYTPKGSDTSYIAYKAANGDLRVLYVLKDEVEIPARLGLNRMATSMLGGLLQAWYSIYVQEAARHGITNPWEPNR